MARKGVSRRETGFKIDMDGQHIIISVGINKILIYQGTRCNNAGNATVMHEPARLHFIAWVIRELFSYGYIAVEVKD
jgi:hypothetical protein